MVKRVKNLEQTAEELKKIRQAAGDRSPKALVEKEKGKTKKAIFLGTPGEQYGAFGRGQAKGKKPK